MKVFTCDIHGECAIAHPVGVAVCKNCPDRALPPAPEPVMVEIVPHSDDAEVRTERPVYADPRDALRARRIAREQAEIDKLRATRERVTSGMVNRGPGTEFSKILKQFGINGHGHAAFRDVLKRHDSLGPEWCEANFEEVGKDWQQVAVALKNPWLSWCANSFLDLAIATARRDIDGTGRPGVAEIAPWNPSRRSRNLLFYVAPFTGSVWRRHMAILRRAMWMFDGPKIISYVTGDDMDSPEEVRSELAGFDCKFMQFENKRNLGEVVAWLDALQLLQHTAAPESITFTAHTKGVVRHSLHPEATGHRWADVMYSTCLDHLPLVEAMLDVYVATGPFRRIIQIPGSRSPWHYSGNFYWFQNDEVWNRDWKHVEQVYAGSEGWPGNVWEEKEGGALFFDHTHRGTSSPYSLDEWHGSIDPDYDRWSSLVAPWRTPGKPPVVGPYDAITLGIYAKKSTNESL